MDHGNGVASGAHSSSTGRARPRRRGAALAAGLIAALALGAGSGSASAVTWNHGPTLKILRTLPDLHPERVRLTTDKAGATDTDVFVAPKRDYGNWQTGPMILNPQGKLLWYLPMAPGQRAFNFNRQTYEGKPVLTWWQGQQAGGFGSGEDVIYDTNYRQIATVQAGKGLKADLHEFQITPQNTALLIAYKPVRMDLRSVGGTKNDLAMDNVMEEIDIKTGKVLLAWHTAQHIKPTESYGTVPADPKAPFDYVHMNSVDLAKDGNILISGRGTHAYYEIDRKTGKLLWRMGGKRSDFKMGPGARTAWQHDVRSLTATRISAFDNNAAVPAKGVQSRGVILKVDVRARTVRLIKAFKHRPKPILAASQGNMQSIQDARGRYTGNEMVGWGGDNQAFTEFNAKGDIVWEATFLSDKVDTYRAYKQTWSGNAPGVPLLNVQSSGGRTVARMSWNGATQISSWRVLGGPTGGTLTPVGSIAWSDLETGLTLGGPVQQQYQVQALDAAGNVLGTSAPVGVTAG